MLKTTPIQLLVQQEVELLPKEGFHAYVLVSLAQENVLHTIMKNCKHQPSHKTFDVQCCLACKICLYNGNTKLVEITNQYLI